MLRVLVAWLQMIPVTFQPPSLTRAPIAILGVPFDNVTTAETLEIIGAMVASGRPHYGATANVDFVVQALEDPELRRILFDAHLVLADGMPLVWASKFLGNPLSERVTGSGMIPQLLALAEQKGWKVFFLGGTEQSVATAAEKTRAKHPRLKLVGAYSPPFKPLLEMDHADILRRLREVKPDILLVAFGCPKQEKWIALNLAAAGVPFSVGVGATIDFLAGTFKRAPVWMQKTGAEWIFRMLQEPKRLVKRYGKDLWVFGRAIWQQWWQMRSRNKPAAAGAKATVTSDQPGIAIVKIPDQLTAVEVQQNRAAWSQTLEQGGLVFDLADTELADSTGVGLLIRLRKRARELNRGFVLAAPRPQVVAALQLMKLEDFFAIETSVAAARIRLNNETRRAEVVECSQPGDLVIFWRGDVTAANVDELTAQTEMELNPLPPGAIVKIDLTSVTFVDSSGVGLMVRLKKNLHRRDIALTFRHPAAIVREVLRLTRLDAFLLEAKP